MIKVYMETNVISELVAIFSNEEIYLSCLPALEKIKEKYNWDRITESEEETTLNELINPNRV
jgi:hypothetical protein